MQFYSAKWFAAEGQLKCTWVAQRNGDLTQVWHMSKPNVLQKAR